MKRNLIALGFGVLGVLAALGGWHLYQDHLLVDALRVNLMQQQAAQAAQQAEKPK